MADLRPALHITGVLLIILGSVMLGPALIDFANAHPDWRVFVLCSFLTSFSGIALWLSSRKRLTVLTVRQAFLMTASAWSLLSFFGALPFLWSDSVSSYTDALFESVSGLTTTGSTVIIGLDGMPPGILFWRALLQWLGGLGIIVMAVAVLPMLQVGGMQLFKAEAFDLPDKILPRTEQVANALIFIFSGLTLLCAFFYALAGMEVMDAIMHAMTTLATGGFSSKDASFMQYKSASIDIIAIVFMCLGSFPFLLYLSLLKGRLKGFLKESQIRAFLGTLVFLSLLAWSYQLYTTDENIWEALRYCVFTVVSLVTTTGFVNTDYTHWGLFPIIIFFIATFIGGCSGSSAGGIKIFRLQIIWSNIKSYLGYATYPHGVFLPRFNGMIIYPKILSSITLFFFLYILTFLVTSGLLGLMGLDMITAFSAAVSALSNIGPGLGELVGPATTFQSLSPLVKWLLLITMILGRLELFTIFVLFMPQFWRS